MQRIRRRRAVRSQRGAMGTVLFLLVLQICFIAAALSVDIAHQISVRAELQAATDAAAMAGEEVLLAQTPVNQTAATTAATTICKANSCDGKLLSANYKAQIDTVIGSTGGTPSLPTLKVTATLPTLNLFGLLIGHGSDRVSCSSTAGPGQVKTAFTVFPLSVIERNYQPNTTYTWYMADAPGLVPSLTNALSMGLTGFSAGSTLPPYPNNMLGANTARFLTTYNANTGGILGAVDNLANGVGGPLGLGSPGTVLGGVVDATVGTTGSTLNTLLQGSSQGPDTSVLSMMDYYSQNVTTTPGSGTFQLTANTQPSANAGSFPSLPTKPIAPPSVSVGQEVYLTTGANSNNGNVLNTTAQFLQGSTGNRPAGALADVYATNQQIMTAAFPGAMASTKQGSTASWLTGQTVILPVTTPVPTQSSINVPLLNINLLGTSNATTSTYSSAATGLLGSVVQPLTGISDATPLSAVVDRFIAVKITGVTVEYQGSNGLSLLGLGLLNAPWYQQVVRITGTVQPNAGIGGYGGSSYASGNATGAYAAMLIQ